MRSVTALFLILVGTVAGPMSCAERSDEGFVYFRTAPMTAAGADSLEAALLAQHLGVSHVAAVGPEVGSASRNGVVAFEARIMNRVARERVTAWLRARPEIVTVGLDKEAGWGAPASIVQAGADKR
jgi:hypothetical protein